MTPVAGSASATVAAVGGASTTVAAVGGSANSDVVAEVNGPPRPEGPRACPLVGGSGAAEPTATLRSDSVTGSPRAAAAAARPRSPADG
jgi:hypothetical protein